MRKKKTNFIVPALTSVLFLIVASGTPADSKTVGSVHKVREFSMNRVPVPVPALAFTDGDGRTVRLKDFRGKVVVLNLWATWCGPCRKEMPTLDRLQAQLGGRDFEVVALSVDFAGAQAVRNFYRDFDIRHLRLFIDRSSRALDQIKVLGLPATLLVDRNGRELGRLVGAAEWDSPKMVDFLRRVIGAGHKEDRTVDAVGPARITNAN